MITFATKRSVVTTSTSTSTLTAAAVVALVAAYAKTQGEFGPDATVTATPAADGSFDITVVEQVTTDAAAPAAPAADAPAAPAAPAVTPVPVVPAAPSFLKAA